MELDPLLPRSRHGPEHEVQRVFVEFLRSKEWFVKPTHGNIYQSGLPDLFAAHPTYRSRWIEMKILDKYSLTRAQRITFPQMSACSVGIWILGTTLAVARSGDDAIRRAMSVEYQKLWAPPNWTEFLEINRPRATRKVKSRRALGDRYVPKFRLPGEQ